MNPACLPRDWLDDPAAAADPWRLVADDPCWPHHRDAFLGNGLIGVRLGPDGEVGEGEGSASFMNGFWGQARRSPQRPEGMAELPRWATLAIRSGDLRRDQAEVREHRQELDLRHATLHTVRRIAHRSGELRIVRQGWVAMADKHLAVLSAEITAVDTRADVAISDLLDASEVCDLAGAESRTDGEDLLLTHVSGRLGRRLAIASRIRLDLDEPQRVYLRQARASGPVARRRFRVALAPGQRLRMTKITALVADHHAENPLATARAEVERASADLPGLRARHEAAWDDLWRHRIETDHPRLQQILNAALFALYSSVRADEPTGHNPCGLSHDGWDGTVFWDTELWTLPVYALFRPDLALACARYRVATLPGALANARERGEAGARWAWQSAASGRECCTRAVFQEERHIVSCVARGQWLAALAAGDRAYLLGPGLTVIRESAAYWAGRARRDDDGTWHIRGVCGADEDAGIVDDNAMTNCGAAWTLRLAERLCREAGQAADPRWREIADGLVIPYDAERGVFKQMATWRHGQTIKQADAVLLAYPWNHPMDDATRARLVDYYRAHYPAANQIMMGLAMDGIVDCQLGRAENAWDCLRALLPHLRRPFLPAYESPDNENASFLTGLGGLLQLVCMGFAGLRITDDEELEVRPCLPPALGRLRLVGIHHQGRERTITLH